LVFFFLFIFIHVRESAAWRHPVLQVADSVRVALAKLQKILPAGSQVVITNDTSVFTRASLDAIQHDLLLSVLLVGGVMLLFLHAWRHTVIVLLAIPTSLVSTFLVMYILGFSLNIMSLMALALMIGILVDDSIVVIENITRYLEEGMKPVDAALRGAREIGFTVLTISISLIAVFIPILLMGGIVGRLFREFAIVLSVAIAVSMVVSLTATPMMCAVLLRPREKEKHGRLYQATERAFDRILHGYDRSLSWVLRHQFLVLLITLGTMAASVYLYIIVPKGFFPQQDTGRLNGNIQADQSSSFQAMQGRMTRLLKIVQKDPAVASVTAFTGGNNSARMFVALKDKRKETADQIIARLRPQLSHEPGANLFLQAVQDLRVGGRQGSAQYQYSLQGDNTAELLQWAPRVQQKLRTLKELVDVNSDQQNKGLQTSLVIDRATAARLGITPQMIDNILYDAFGQRQVSTMYQQLNQYHVIMEVEPQFWQNPDGLKYIYVPAGNPSPSNATATATTASPSAGTVASTTASNPSSNPSSQVARLVPLAAFTHYETTNAPLTDLYETVAPGEFADEIAPDGSRHRIVFAFRPVVGGVFAPLAL